MTRPLLIACLLVLGACDRSSVVGAEARVNVAPQVGFGTVWVGDTARAVLLVESLGLAPVNVTRVAVDDLSVSLSAASGQLAAGGSLRVDLTWRPEAAGPLTARLIVETDVDDAKRLTVLVTGQAKELPVCDDGNQCTDDVFDRALAGCTFTPHARACDDGNACTTQDTCVAGTCRGQAVTCDDDDVCTRDLCDAATGCFHPPDDRVCDDGDPCTTNVCHREDGCSYPDAPNGTACGEFTCATAHLCVGGTCRAIDATGLSDNEPCSDGDACTMGDRCLAGECVPGDPVRSEPEVTARFETFGGAGSLVGSDGTRFLFADRDALRVAVLGVDGALSHVGTLPFRATLAPVKVGPARFLVAHDDVLALVDVSDAALPRLVWQQQVSAPAAQAGRIHALAAGHQGVALVFGETEGLDQVAPATVLWVPLEGDDLLAQAPTVLASLPLVTDLDVSGLMVAWTDQQRVWLSRLPSSKPERAPVPEHVVVPARRLSLEGLRLAALTSTHLRVIDLARPATPKAAPCTEPPCETVFVACAGGPVGEFASCEEATCGAGLTCGLLLVEGCPTCDCDAVCCAPEPRQVCMRPGTTGQALLEVEAAGALDVLLSGRVLAWATAAGVMGVAMDEAALMASSVTVLDRMPALTLERAPGALLAMGTMSLPLSLREAIALEPPTPAPPSVLRLTGPRHGDVRVIADGFGTRISLAGPMAVGQLDVVQQGLSSWTLLPTTSSSENPRILKGATRWATVEETFRVSDATNECAPLETVTGLGALDTLELCGHHGGPSDLAGTMLWAHASVSSENPIKGARAWHLLPHEPEPVVDLRDSQPVDGHSAAMRGSDRGTFGVYIEALDERLRVSILRAGQPASAVVGSVEVPRTDGLKVFRTRAASDGNLVLIGDTTSVSLYDAADPAVVPRATLELPSEQPIDVEWMAGGRGWLSWQSEEGMRLSQIYFDAAGALVDEGEIALPGAVGRVFDTGLLGVVTAGSEILMVAPACR